MAVSLMHLPEGSACIPAGAQKGPYAPQAALTSSFRLMLANQVIFCDDLQSVCNMS